MRIIGTGKIDDFQKVVLSNKVLKSLGVKPGDSLIFFRGKSGGSSTVQMFRAEGAHLSNEVDSKPPSDNGKSIKYLFMAIIALISLLLLLMINAFETNKKFDMGSVTAYLLIAEAIVVAALLYICVRMKGTVKKTVGEKLITINGPMAYDRLIGLSKILSDGRVVSGTIFLYPMFGTNPDSVKVYIKYSNGTMEPLPIKCIENGPGFSEYKMRVADVNLDNGSLIVNAIYKYSNKAIVVDAAYGIKFDENDRFHIDVPNANISAVVRFDNEFQKAKFDEGLFDPEDEEIAI